MKTTGTTPSGYTVIAILPGEQSPMVNHLGGEVAVDDTNKHMYVHDVFVVTYGLESIMKSCGTYKEVTP